MTRQHQWYCAWGKRVIDLALTLLTSPIWIPAICALALAVRAWLGSPVLFRQVRPGLYGRPFTLLKLRTMSNMASQKGVPLPDEKRLGPFGRMLRAASLDELPELLNVLRGEMSLVGPRPLLTKYLCLYSQEQARRHDVRPGITGWAQVHGRNALSWEDKFELDVWYVDHVSLSLDLKTLFVTVATVLRGKGIRADGYPTMPEFIGNRNTDG